MVYKWIKKYESSRKSGNGSHIVDTQIQNQNSTTFQNDQNEENQDFNLNTPKERMKRVKRKTSGVATEKPQCPILDSTIRDKENPTGINEKKSGKSVSDEHQLSPDKPNLIGKPKHRGRRNPKPRKSKVLEQNKSESIKKNDIEQGAKLD